MYFFDTGSFYNSPDCPQTPRFYLCIQCGTSLDMQIYLFFKAYLFYDDECFAYMCVCVPHLWSVGSPGTGLTDKCELPCGCWEMNPGTWQENKCFQALSIFSPALNSSLVNTVTVVVVFLTCRIG